MRQAAVALFVAAILLSGAPPLAVAVLAIGVVLLVVGK